MRKFSNLFLSGCLGIILGSGLFISKQVFAEPVFNLVFRYGMEANNELDTFKGTYTKDMLMDSPFKVNMVLTMEDLNKIYQKMMQIGFFDYPDKFFVTIPAGENASEVAPHFNYYFKVEHDSKVKELWWEDKIVSNDLKAEELRGLIKLIRDIIESKQEYKELPHPRGGYE